VRLNRSIFVVLVLLFAVVACSASKRPVLYPNEHFQRIGEATAARDECMRLAEQYTSGGGQESQVAKEAARDAAIGGATGAAVGGDLRQRGPRRGGGSCRGRHGWIAEPTLPWRIVFA